MHEFGPETFPAGCLAVLIGPAAAGKSSIAAKWPSLDVVCLDELRERLTGAPGDQSATAEAVVLQHLLLDGRLARGRKTLADSTNVEARVRGGLLARARRHRRETVALLLTTPLEECLRRNAARTGPDRVPEEVLRWQNAQARALTPEVLLREGFTAVHLLKCP